ncbi:hypothetical protein GCM10011350_38830 [Marinomonas arctica]|nr:hypothetical protein [Marinomonas arctica]GGN38675.1 hypothetical protein GCM10011350_38830 [Marinomonas arctica]
MPIDDVGWGCQITPRTSSHLPPFISLPAQLAECDSAGQDCRYGVSVLDQGGKVTPTHPVLMQAAESSETTDQVHQGKDQYPS